jgi:U3 small nucleolar RNA-associated protein 12
VRAVAVGSDGSRVATCSTEGVKVWNMESGTCVSSALCGYGVSLAFAPGGRYVIVGSKEGSIQVKYDTLLLISVLCPNICVDCLLISLEY